MASYAPKGARPPRASALRAFAEEVVTLRGRHFVPTSQAPLNYRHYVPCSSSHIDNAFFAYKMHVGLRAVLAHTHTVLKIEFLPGIYHQSASLHTMHITTRRMVSSMTSNLDIIMSYSAIYNLSLELDKIMAKMCCKYNNLELLRQCNFCVGDVDKTDIISALVEENNIDAIKYLIKKCDRTEYYSLHQSIIYYASMAGTIDILLLVKDECIGAYLDQNICNAASMGHFAVVKFLIGLLPNNNNLPRYAIHATASNDLETFKLCTAYEFEPQEYIRHVLQSRSVKILEYLVANGAIIDINAHVLIKFGMEMLDYLYTHGHIPDVKKYVLRATRSKSCIKYFRDKGELKNCKKELLLSAIYREDFKMIDIIRDV